VSKVKATASTFLAIFLMLFSVRKRVDQLPEIVCQYEDTLIVKKNLN
jgi:hypothetical protein